MYSGIPPEGQQILPALAAKLQSEALLCCIFYLMAV